MGTYLSKNEEEISESLKEEYDIEAQPYLLHRRTQQLCTLHKLTANSMADSARIRQAIEEYQKSRCESISKLRTHYHLDSTGYCSDQQSFFLVFQGQNSYTLREEFAKRRLFRSPFNEIEIQQVAQTFLCGLREYDHRFQRDYDRLSLESLVIDQRTKRLYLRDPWLAGEKPGQGDPLTSLLLHYPSPEKLRTAYSSKCEDYKEFLSNLFSVAAIALQLKRLEFADGIYIKKREVNYDEIKVRLNQFMNERLRKGLECLLDPNPNERKKIYQMWGIQNREQHFLQPILPQKQDSSPILKIQNKHEPSPSLSHFQFTSTSNFQQERQLKMVPSETVIAPPLTIQQTARTTQQLSSRSNKSLQRPQMPTNLPPQSLHPSPLLHSYHQTAKPVFNSHHMSMPGPLPNGQYYGPPVPSFQSLSSFLRQQQPLPSFIDQKQINSKSPQIPTFTFTPPPPSTIPSTIASDIYNRKSVETLPNDSKAQQIPSFVKTQTLPIYVPSPNVASSAVSKPQSNGWSFNPLTDYKQSIYQPIRPSNQVSLPTYVESPVKQREIRSILVDQKHEAHPPIEKSPSIIDKILAENVENQQEEPRPIPNKEDKQKQAEIANNLLKAISDEESSPVIIQDNNQQPISSMRNQLSDTPVRPTSKNKYNSTIVEVRDEDSPEPSLRSQEALQEEYVVEEYETGSRYEGFKSNGMRNGRGKFYYQDGGYYEGHWRNNKMDGFGRLYYEGGKLAYQGNWSQDQFNGSGKVYNDNPVPFDVAFDYTNFELLEDYWEYYEGMLVHDTKEGRGRIRLSNGEIFQGDFHNDRIQGFGKFYNREGKVIEGIWRESKLIKVINAGDR